MQKPILEKMSIKKIVVTVAFFTLLSACGGRGVKFEINQPESSSQQLRELAEAQQSGSQPANRELPEMTAEEYEAFGDALLNKGKPALAYVQYEKALKAKPDNVQIEYKKGFTLLTAGNYDDAISQFNLVVKKDPKFDAAYEGLGMAYFQKKDFKGAEAAFRKAIDLNHRLWRSYNYIGNIYDHNKDYEKAILEYTSAISVRPDQGLLYNNLGVSCSLAGHYQAAVDAFTMAIRTNYRESRVYNNMAVALANLGRYEDALEAFKKGGGEAHAYNNMGCIYLDKGNYPEAVRCFEKAIVIEPSFYAKASDNLKKAKTMAAKQ